MVTQNPESLQVSEYINPWPYVRPESEREARRLATLNRLLAEAGIPEVTELPQYRLARQLTVVRLHPGEHGILFVDGSPFSLYTVDGFTIHPTKPRMPTVSLSIAAKSVRVIDSEMDR
jgi:hypothetical protein